VPAYLVERYIPGLSEVELRSGLKRVEAACQEASAQGNKVRYRGSMFLALEETCFCWFDSDRRETAAKVNQLAQMPFARITEAVVILPDGKGSPG
jgi:hypothetical protein